MGAKRPLRLVYIYLYIYLYLSIIEITHKGQTEGRMCFRLNIYIWWVYRKRGQKGDFHVFVDVFSQASKVIFQGDTIV